jgi:hypothetical protein
VPERLEARSPAACQLARFIYVECGE